MAWELLKVFFTGPGTPDTSQPRVIWQDASAVETEFKELVAVQLQRDVETITPATNMFDEADSVGTIEIVMLCEETFEIEIPDEAAEHLLTVGQMVAFVQQKLGLHADQR